jgi:hypothetical protein
MEGLPSGPKGVGNAANTHDNSRGICLSISSSSCLRGVFSPQWFAARVRGGINDHQSAWQRRNLWWVTDKKQLIEPILPWIIKEAGQQTADAPKSQGPAGPWLGVSWPYNHALATCVDARSNISNRVKFTQFGRIITYLLAISQQKYSINFIKMLKSTARSAIAVLLFNSKK